MNCPVCKKEMNAGYLFTTKDGAFSFADNVPGVFTPAKRAPGFIRITALSFGHRAHFRAEFCKDCRVLMLNG